MPRNSAEYDRTYRATRRALGRPVARGADAALEFVAWDGEGETTVAATGVQSKAQWESDVREEARRWFDSETLIGAPYYRALAEHGGRIIPGEYRGKMRGEFANIPKHLRGKPHGDGNVDKIAQVAGVDAADVLDYFAEHPVKPTWARALAYARRSLASSYPQPGTHNYTLLANSRDGVVARGEALSSVTIFDALLAGKQRYPNAVHCFFGGSYDATMALKDAPREAIEQLWRADRRPVTIFKQYRCLYRPRRSLWLAKFGAPHFLDRKPNYVAKAMFWDVWGFFQASFVGALEKYGFDRKLVDAIAVMKARRSEFDSDDRASYETYCVNECKLLEELMKQLAGSLIEAGLRPKAWNGAGAVASALLQREGVKAAIAIAPTHLRNPIAVAYFGGRVELCQHGWAQRAIAGADVASAYPWAMQELPDLRAQWQRRERTIASLARAFALYHLRFHFPTPLPWYPLPYRTPRKTILFPAHGEGWYWHPEAAAAIAFADRWGGDVEILDAWELCDDGRRPFAFMPDLFAKRKRWKQEGNGAEKAAKLGYNACYGKLAQQLGGDEKTMPPFHSLAWAGYITSATRARLVEAAIGNPAAVIAFATDGIASTQPLTLPDYGTMLGAWETSSTDDAVFVQAGVYWLMGDDGRWQPKYRGFDRTMLEEPYGVLDAWENGRTALELPCTRFVALGSALCSPDLWNARGTWRTVTRTLDLTGKSAKRGGVRFAGACDLAPLPVHWNVDYDVTGALSEPYRLAWEPSSRLDGAPEEVIEAEAADSWL